MKRSGIADLPLHGGRVPPWLAETEHKTHGFVRMVETRLKPNADFEATVRHENAISPSLNGRTVLDDRRQRVVNRRQGSLF